MDKILNLTEMEIDALKELGNIGTGNAATALSNLINKRIKIVIPETKFIPITEFSLEFGGPEKMVTAVYLQITGELNGEAVFLFTHEDTLKLIDLLTGRQIGTTKIIDDASMSALKEMTNIFSGSYLNALSNLINRKIIPSIPNVTNDMVQAVFDFILAKVSLYAQKILAVKTKINIEGIDVGGDFMLFFHADSYKHILSALAVKYDLNKTNS